MPDPSRLEPPHRDSFQQPSFSIASHMNSSSVQASERHVAAGEFGRWLAQTRAALQGAQGADVPCGDCVGCCVSSYYIPIRRDDAGALARIPLDALVRTPGATGGHAVMGYRADGTCHMLESNKCSIYADRPQTCRDYDCRIFAAAGIDAGDAAKTVINRRVHAWRFTYANDAERLVHDAIRRAAVFIRDKRDSFPGARVPVTPTGIAVLAVKVYTVFLDPSTPLKSDVEIALDINAANRAFDAVIHAPK
jgi:Fe-S-cluster containining protein